MYTPARPPFRSPTRGPMPRRISRKPTASPSSTLAAPSPFEARPAAEGTAAPARDAQVVERAAEWTLSPTEEFASPIVGVGTHHHHHHSLPSPVQAQSRGVQPRLTRPQKPPPPPPQRDSAQVRQRLQSLQEHLSAFLRSTDPSDGGAAAAAGSVIEVEVLAARLAEAGMALRRSLAVGGDQVAGSGSSEESGNEQGY